MLPRPFALSKNVFLAWGVPLLLAFILGVGILSTTTILTGKWLAAATIVFFVPWILIASGNVELCLLFLFVFFLPVNLDFSLTPSEKYTPGAGAITVSVCDLALAGLYVIWIFKLISSSPGNRRLRWFPSLSVPFGFLWFCGALSSIWAPKPLLSFYELIELAKMWFGFLYLANNIDGEAKITTIIVATAFAVLGQSALGFTQHFSKSTLGLEILGESQRGGLLFQKTGVVKLSRVGGTMGHPNALATFLIIALPIVLSHLFSKKRFWSKALALLALAMGFMTLILTFSRGGWIAFLIGAACTVFLGIWKNRGFLSACAASAVFWLFLFLLALPFISAISTRLFEHDYGRAMSRIPLMQVAGNIIRAHPLEGVGLNNYTVVMQDYDDTKEAITTYFPMPVHNMYLLTAAETGLPSLFFLLWFLAVALKMGWEGFWKNKGLESLFCLGFMGGLVAALIQKLVEYWYLSSYFFSLIIGVFGAARFWHERQDTNR